MPDEVIDCGLFPASHGFERVEQIDVEECGIFATAKPYVTDQQELFQPPVKTIAWFHTGVFIDERPVLSRYARECTLSGRPACRDFQVARGDDHKCGRIELTAEFERRAVWRNCYKT